MGNSTRKFESETIGGAGLQPVAAKQEPRDIDGAAFSKMRHKEGRDKAQVKFIVLRLIEYFEEGPSGLGEL
jgi:hypothetical protein